MNPRPTPSWLEDIYSRSGHGLTAPADSEVIERRERDFPATTIDARRIIAAAISASSSEAHDPLTALDIGSGYGFFSRELCRQGCRVTAVNPGQWENAVFRALNGFDPIPRFFEAVDFNGQLFDIVILSQVLEHVPDPFAFLKRIHSVMQPRGVLGLAVPNRQSFLVALRGLRDQSCFWVPEHLNYFCSRSLQTLLKRAGFQGLGQHTVTRIPPHRMIERMRLSGSVANIFTELCRYGQLPLAVTANAFGKGLYINATAVRQ